MIVDGSAQFTGSDGNRATKEIIEASKDKKASIELSIDAADKMKIKISKPPEGRENASVFLAIAEDNLTTSVRRGENSGKTLEHVSVVRELKSIGSLGARDEFFETETVFQIQTNWKKENLKFVVFVQGNQSRKIYGAKQARGGKREN